MEFLFTIESLGLSFMEIRLGANGIGAPPPQLRPNFMYEFTDANLKQLYFQ